MPVPRARSTVSWDGDEPTPVCSPAPSAAVSRTPTLVDLVAYGHEDAADGKKDDIDGAAREPEDDTPAGDKNHQLRFPHLPHLPPHPHQHLERFVPPEHYPTTDEVAAEKAERARSEDEADPEKADPISPIAAAAKDDDSYPDGGFKAWSVVAGAWAVSFTAWGKSFECGRLIFRSVLFRGSGGNPLSAQLARRPNTRSFHRLGERIRRASILLFYAFAVRLSGVFTRLDRSLPDRREPVLCCLFRQALRRRLRQASPCCRSTRVYCWVSLRSELSQVVLTLPLTSFVHARSLFGLSYATSYWQVFLSQGVACGVRESWLFSLTRETYVALTQLLPSARFRLDVLARMLRRQPLLQEATNACPRSSGYWIVRASLLAQ